MKMAFVVFLAGALVSSAIRLPASEPTPQPAAPSGAASSPTGTSPKSGDSTSTSLSSEVVGEWSEIVEHMRGRLVAEFGIDASGATEVGISIELQNFNTGVLGRRIVTLARDRSLHWEMTGAHGKAAPEWAGFVPWTIDFFYVNETVSVPASGRVRTGLFLASPTGKTVRIVVEERQTPATPPLPGSP